MVRSMALTLRARGHGRFSIPDRSRHLLDDARRDPGRGTRRLAAVDARRHADELGEARAEGPERRAADREADFGHAQVAAAQQRHRALDAPRHEVAVRRLPVGEAELAAEVPGRHVRAARERLDVERLGVLAVDPVADAAQPRQVGRALLRHGSARHLRDRGTSRRRATGERDDSPVHLYGFAAPRVGAAGASVVAALPAVVVGADVVGVARRAARVVLVLVAIAVVVAVVAAVRDAVAVLVLAPVGDAVAVGVPAARARAELVLAAFVTPSWSASSQPSEMPSSSESRSRGFVPSAISLALST